jgi:hypothetical protein
MSYLHYLCLFAYSDVQHILYCVFVFLVFVLCTLCCQLLWIVLKFTSSDYLFGIFWSLYCMSLNLRLLITFLVSLNLYYKMV